MVQSVCDLLSLAFVKLGHQNTVYLCVQGPRRGAGVVAGDGGGDGGIAGLGWGHLLGNKTNTDPGHQLKLSSSVGSRSMSKNQNRWRGWDSRMAYQRQSKRVYKWVGNETNNRAIAIRSAEQSQVGTISANVDNFVLMKFFTTELLLGWPKVKLFSKKPTPSFSSISAYILEQSINHFKEKSIYFPPPEQKPLKLRNEITHNSH